MNNNRGKIISQFLHFDSISSTPIYDANNTSGNTSNCYNAKFPLTTSFRKIKRVYMKSIELVMGFPNIRTGSTNTLKYTINGTKYTTTLAAANYTTIDDLITAINAATAITLNLTGFSLFVASYQTYYISVLCQGAVSSFSLQETLLSKYVLGIASTDTYSVGLGYMNGSNKWNLSPDNYLNVYMPSFNSYNANQTGAWSTFKLPLNSVLGNVYYYQDQSSFEQFVDITDDNLVLSNLQVVIYDRFGNNINPYGLDYSFTLQIDYEL